MATGVFPSNAFESKFYKTDPGSWVDLSTKDREVWLLRSHHRSCVYVALVEKKGRGWVSYVWDGGAMVPVIVGHRTTQQEAKAVAVVEARLRYPHSPDEWQQS